MVRCIWRLPYDGTCGVVPKHVAELITYEEYTQCMSSWFCWLIYRTMHGIYNPEIIATQFRYFNLLMSDDVLGSQRVFYPLRGQTKSFSLQLPVIKPDRLRVEPLKGLLTRYKLKSHNLYHVTRLKTTAPNSTTHLSFVIDSGSSLTSQYVLGVEGFSKFGVNIMLTPYRYYRRILPCILL